MIFGLGAIAIAFAIGLVAGMLVVLMPPMYEARNPTIGGWNGRGDYPFPPGSYRNDRGFCLMYGYQPNENIVDAKPPGEE